MKKANPDDQPPEELVERWKLDTNWKLEQIQQMVKRIQKDLALIQ